MTMHVSPTSTASADSGAAAELFALRVRAAFSESRLAIALILPVVALAVVLLWAKVEHWRLLAWGVALGGAYGARLLLYAAYARGAAARSTSNEQRYADALNVALAVAGFAWSALYWLVAVPIGGDTAPVTAAVLMAVAGVALSGLSTLPAGYAAFTTAMLLPTAILLVASGNASYFALGWTVALYTLSMNLLALRSCRQFERHALLDIARLGAEARFRDIASASGDWFWESDAQGRLTWISESVERITGTPPEWFIGRMPQEMVVTAETLDAPAWEARRLARERHEPYRDFRYQLRHLHGEVWISNSGTPRFGARGNFLGYRGATTDISERMRAEQAMGQQSEYLRAAQTAARMIVIDWDITADKISFSDNPVWLRGPPPLDGKPYPLFRDQVHPDDLAEFLAARTRAVELFQASEPEFRFVRTDGQVVWVKSHQTVLAGPSGKAIRLVSALQDITERKRGEIALAEARDAAQAANRAKSQFLANMSHEIRTPMNGVLGMAALLLDEPLTVAQHRRAEAIRSSGEALLKIIDDILDFSKIEAGKLVLDSMPMDLRALAEQVRVLLEPACSAKGVSFEYVIEAALPAWVLGDAVRVRQVLINLAGNAVKFTMQGSVQVALSCARAGENPALVHFDIIDTGRGIAHGAQPGLFAPFTQADASITREYGGTGLGLAISQQLVQAMGGQIGLESAVGEGSRFWFVLPLPPAHSPVDAPGASTQSAAPRVVDNRRFHANVLLAEDNEINQEVARGALQKYGCRVTTVNNGRAALDAIAREAFDLVLMDCQMPELDGLAATRMIRQAERGGARHLPVVALTANAFATDRANCLAAGMDDYLCKPFCDGEIAAMLQRWLAPERDAKAVNVLNLGESGEMKAIETTAAAMPATPQMESDAPIFSPDALAMLRAYQVAGEEDMVTGVLRRFLGGAEAHMATMRTAMEQDDVAAAGAAAHGMKASAAFAGALRLSAACAQLDNAARGGAPGLARQAFTGLLHEYESARPFLQAALQAATRETPQEAGPSVPAMAAAPSS